MTNHEIAGFYSKLCADLIYTIPHKDLEWHQRNAAEHVACADSPVFDQEATREGIAQVLRLAGILPLNKLV